MRDPVQPPSVLRLLRLRFLAIAIPSLVIASAALAFSLLQEKKYEASTWVLFRHAEYDAPTALSQSPAHEVVTNLGLLQLEAVKERVEARLDSPVKGDVKVAADGENTHLATIIVTDSNPKRAARVANAYAEEYVDLRQENFQTEVEREREAVRAELAALPPTPAGVQEAEALEDRLKELAVDATAPSGVTHLTPAEPPSQASSPKPVQNTAIGAMVGLALGVALAIALERRDRRVRDPRYMEYVLGRPIVGRIPRSRALAKLTKPGRGTAPLPPAEAEAFRTLRANLRRQLKEQETRSVLVTSAIPGEGKTTLVWNLARVEAASGARVLVVEADMRRPVLSRSLGADGAAGLSELLAGDTQLQELVRPVGVEDRVDGDGHPPGSVDVLFAGRPPANPAELLDSERMQAVLEVIPDSYDLVVLDTPPTVVSDAMPILDHVGGVVVVGRLGLTTGEALVELRDQLDHLDAPTLGVVVNGDSVGLSRYYASKAVERFGPPPPSSRRLVDRAPPASESTGGRSPNLGDSNGQGVQRA
jgi:succinoglycan biosynthesis transport protein ExoP